MMFFNIKNLVQMNWCNTGTVRHAGGCEQSNAHFVFFVVLVALILVGMLERSVTVRLALGYAMVGYGSQENRMTTDPGRAPVYKPNHGQHQQAVFHF